MHFSKYHALGNDYVVVEAADFAERLTPTIVDRICARHFGIGADGILVREADPAAGSFRLRIINADASEAEKSGNGLRIFARYLWDRDEVADEPFAVETLGGLVTCQVFPDGRMVAVDMGRVSFHSHDVPVVGPPREVLRETLEVNGQRLEYSAASIGNPHCVVPREQVSAAESQSLGPLIETDTRFPNLTNVQFMQVLDRGNLRIEIWERGVGYTLASGTSSCAAAAVAHRLGLCDNAVTVHMPGGDLAIDVAPNYEVRMTGPVVKVAEGRFSEEVLAGVE
jgi:diaminopimelate epimerase